MTPFELGLEAIWVAGLTLAFPRIRNSWKDPAALARLEGRWRSFWPYSEAALQGWVRAQVAIYLIGCLMAVFYPIGILFRTSTGSTETTLAVVFLLGIVGIVLMLGLAMATVLFSRPKLLVFPAKRAQAGALVGWWHRRRTSK